MYGRIVKYLWSIDNSVESGEEDSGDSAIIGESNEEDSDDICHCLVHVSQHTCTT
jgi:hypothetical protein